VAGQIRHQEGGSDQNALEVAKFDPPEFAAGLAGGVEILPAVTPPDLRREQVGGGLEVSVQEVAEEHGVVHDLLILLRRAGEADRFSSSGSHGRTIGHRHEAPPADVLPG
jgi:hypothetical protein